MGEVKGITLSELIRNVADELRKVEAEAPKEGAVMEFQECELELNVNVSFEGGAGVNFWIIDMGGKGDREAGHTVRVKFSSIEGRRVQAQSQTVAGTVLPERARTKKDRGHNGGEC